MDVGLLSSVAKALRPIGEAALRGAVRLHAERKAVTDPTSSSTTLLEDSLNETFSRLRGGQVDDRWWRQLFNVIGQNYVAPDWLKEPVVQEWLTSDQVRADVIAIAKAKIVDSPLEGEASIRERLSEGYSGDSGGATEWANDAIDVIVAVLAAGYIATIPREQRALAGLVQELHREVSRGRQFDEARALTRDRIVEDVHTREAEQALAAILTWWKFDIVKAIREIQELWSRIGVAE